MRENERLLRRIIDLSPMSMAIVGLDGCIEYINQKAIVTFGYSHKDIPTMDHWWKKAYPDAGYRKIVLDRWMGKVRSALAEKSEIKGDEYLVTCKDGSVKTIFIFGVPVASKVFVLFNDITAYKSLQSELERHRDELEQKVRDRTSKLQALAEEVIRVEHRERLRIAHVLHEDLQQWLAAASFRLGELQECPLTSRAKQASGRVQHMLDKAIEVTRSLAVDLRPPIVHGQGLSLALRWLAEDFRQKFELSVSVKVGHVSVSVTEEIGVFVFDAVNELLLNVAKHAGVKVVTVRLIAMDPDRFRVEVKDQGSGFNPARDAEKKFGLFSIRERADVLGGSMKIISAPGKGTTVELKLPLKSKRRY